MLIKSEVPFPLLGMNWTMAELSPKFSLETMYWKLSLYSLCPVPLSILNFSASPICCWNSWMCHKRRRLKFLYISVGNQANLISNDPWDVRQCSVCLCALGGSRDSQQEKWLSTQPVYILFPCIIQGLRSNDVFYDGLAPQSVLLCFRAVCLGLISIDGVVVVVPHPKKHPQT